LLLLIASRWLAQRGANQSHDLHGSAHGRRQRLRARRSAMIYILMWLLGLPLTLIIILFLLGIGR